MDTTAITSIITQGSPEWYQIRLGKFTSSEIHRLMTEPKLAADKKAGNLSDGAMTYVLEKVHEQLTGEPASSFDSMATVWGVQNEPLARAWYEKLTDCKVTEAGFEMISESYGGSADGLVDFAQGVHDNGGIEIKCPFKGSNHLEHCLISDQEYMKVNFKDHYWQCVSNCFIYGRDWWDFISFDPRLDYDSGFFKIRIVPPQEDIEILCKKIEQAVKTKNELLQKFTTKAA